MAHVHTAYKSPPAPRDSARFNTYYKVQWYEETSLCWFTSKSSTRRAEAAVNAYSREAVPHDGSNPEGPPAALNMKTHLIIAATLLLARSALADSYRVHYSIRGNGRDITVQAESSAEARRTVMDMFPGAVVTGVHRVR